MSYLEKIMLVCGDQPAVYKELHFEPMQIDEEEGHFRAELDQHVSVILTQSRDGTITGAAIRTSDPAVVEQVESRIRKSDG